VFRGEAGRARDLSRAELATLVGAVAGGLRRLGVGVGDRVAAILPNGPEAVIAFLAAASIGAIWAVCSPEFGPEAVTDRFRQIEPKVLIIADGYRYGGQDYDRLPVLRRIVGELPFMGLNPPAIVVPGQLVDPERGQRGLQDLAPQSIVHRRDDHRRREDRPGLAGALDPELIQGGGLWGAFIRTWALSRENPLGRPVVTTRVRTGGTFIGTGARPFLPR